MGTRAEIGSGLPKAVNEGIVLKTYGHMDINVDTWLNRGRVLESCRASDHTFEGIFLIKGF